MWHDLLRAFALVLVLEGISPFLSPDRFRQALALAARMNSTSLRILGLGLMLLGLLILYGVK